MRESFANAEILRKRIELLELDVAQLRRCLTSNPPPLVSTSAATISAHDVPSSPSSIETASRSAATAKDTADSDPSSPETTSALPRAASTTSASAAHPRRRHSTSCGHHRAGEKHENRGEQPSRRYVGGSAVLATPLGRLPWRRRVRVGPWRCRYESSGGVVRRDRIVAPVDGHYLVDFSMDLTNESDSDAGMVELVLRRQNDTVGRLRKPVPPQGATTTLRLLQVIEMHRGQALALDLKALQGSRVVQQRVDETLFQMAQVRRLLPDLVGEPERGEDDDRAGNETP